MSDPVRIIAYDPGDRWVGFAVLGELATSKDLAGLAGVYDRERKSYAAVEDLARLFTGLNADVVIEEFRVRPAGYNAFYDGATPKLIGALEYVASRFGRPVYYAPAGDPMDILQTPLGDRVMAWKRSWPRAGGARWHHALSAWRILGYYLMVEKPQLLAAIGHSKLRDWTYTGELDIDLMAPAVRLVLP